MTVLVTIITSAAVGTLVSNLMTLWGQHLERRSRREELALNQAVGLAVSHRDFVFRFYQQTGRGTVFTDPGTHVSTYYR